MSTSEVLHSIRRRDVEDALREVVGNDIPVPPGRESRGYCLVWEGRHFPPKWVLSRAGRFSPLGREIGSSEFYGGPADAGAHLIALGFGHVPCPCGGRGKPNQGTHDQETKPSVSPSLAMSASASVPTAVCGQAGDQCALIHRLVNGLPEYRSAKEIGRVAPPAGAYFFYEKDENCPNTGQPRIVRVGINKSATLISRLRGHYAKGGPHSLGKDGSAFRALLGDALLRRSDPDSSCLSHWNRHMDRSAIACSRCHDLEESVSHHMTDKMSFRVVAVADLSEREALERSLVGLLSQRPCCQPSTEWLGNSSGSPAVRHSGLWNREHVGTGGFMSENELRRLQTLVGNSCDLTK